MRGAKDGSSRASYTLYPFAQHRFDFLMEGSARGVEEMLFPPGPGGGASSSGAGGAGVGGVGGGGAGVSGAGTGGGTGPPTTPSEVIPPSTFDLISTSFHISDTIESYHWLIQSHCARVIFQLSASNWSVVLEKLKAKMKLFASHSSSSAHNSNKSGASVGVHYPTAASSGENMDAVDFYLLKYAALTRVRLVAVMTGARLPSFLPCRRFLH